MAKRTRKQQRLEQVTGILRGKMEFFLANGSDYPLEQARKDNEDGFTFDIRYDDGGYVDQNSWTRVEGYTCSNSDLAVCYRNAELQIAPAAFPVLAVSEVAEQRGCTESAVRLAFAEARLPGRKAGGTLLIDAEAAAAFSPKHGWPKGKSRKAV